MGLRSTSLIIVLTFGILFSFLYASFHLYYAPAHDPDTIPVEPKISQAQVIRIVESEYRKHVPQFQEAYLHFFYYNFSYPRYEDEEDQDYQRYLRSIAPGWNLSDVKVKPDLLNLTLVFVHANGTVYSIDPQAQKFEKICEAPSLDCSLGGKGGEAAKDRLVYEVGANVFGSGGFTADIHYIIDAETGRIVYHSPYIEPRPALPNIILNNQRTLKELEQLIKNTNDGVSVEIVQNASEIALGNRGNMKGYQPAHIIETFSNATLVVWFNHDNASHTVTSDNGYVDLLGNRFDSGIIQPRKSFGFVFTELGDFPYHCEIHPWMKGEVSILPNFA